MTQVSTPLNPNQRKSSKHALLVRSLFSRIAKRYELTNDLISFGMHRIWLNTLVNKVVAATEEHPKEQKIVLVDLCAGTGAVTRSLIKKLLHKKQLFKINELLLVDFCPEMLAIAKTSIEKTSPTTSTSLTRYLCNDACHCDIPSSSVNLITMAYGLRNIQNRTHAYAEIGRLLTSNGNCFILDLTKPSVQILSFLHGLYLKILLPILGYMLTGDRKAYSYLARSIEQFPLTSDLVEEIRRCNLIVTETKTFFFGTATLWRIKKGDC